MAKVMLDKEREMWLGFNELIEFKNARGEELMTAFEKAFEYEKDKKGNVIMEKDEQGNDVPKVKSMDLELIRFLFYLALKEDDETLTEKQVGRLMDKHLGTLMDGFAELMEGMGK